jgi:hypothetical protein
MCGGFGIAIKRARNGLRRTTQGQEAICRVTHGSTQLMFRNHLDHFMHSFNSLPLICAMVAVHREGLTPRRKHQGQPSLRPRVLGASAARQLCVAAAGVSTLLLLGGSIRANAQSVSFAGAQSTVGSGLYQPLGVAVDAAGNLFIADANNNRVLEVPAGGGTQTTVGSGLSHPWDVAVDGAGNVFIADGASDRVLEVQRSQPPTFSFAATPVGNTSTDSPQSVTVQNIGNQLLNAVPPGLTVGSNSFVQVTGSGIPADCSSSFSLAPGASCNLGISFIPQTSDSISSRRRSPTTPSTPLLLLRASP